jgi:NAD(P)-dependent dehydrogenase (short-subunit alcohol dehydrogenase family)
MRVDLAGRVALVTGAAQGIGRATAAAIAANGARVVFTDRTQDAAEQAARATPGDHLAMAMDVGDGDAVDAAVARIAAVAGRLNIVVNNAGIGVRAADRRPIDEFSVAAWEEMLRIDLTGVFRVSRAAVPHLKAAGGGRIVNIASVLGLVPMRLQSSYVAAKAGVVNLTRSMALELAPHGILVNAVAPGSTATAAWSDWMADATSEKLDLHARLMSHIPLGRPARTEEIAAGVLFLVAPESSYVTGHVLAVDGGWTAGFARDF